MPSLFITYPVLSRFKAPADRSQGDHCASCDRSISFRCEWKGKATRRTETETADGARLDFMDGASVATGRRKVVSLVVLFCRGWAWP
jgi:hypothetical protein